MDVSNETGLGRFAFTAEVSWDIAEANMDGDSDIRHDDVGNYHAVDDAAINDSQVDPTFFCVMNNAVGDGDVLKSTIGFSSEFQCIGVTCQGTV